MKKEKSCGAVVYWLENNNPLYLLLKHKNGGHWSFPKGHVEKDETEIETARREIKEETGLAVQIDKNYSVVVTFPPKPGVMKDVVYFSAKVLNKKVIVQKEEIEEFKWLNYKDSNIMLTYQNDLDLLEKMNNYILNNL